MTKMRETLINTTIGDEFFLNLPIKKTYMLRKKHDHTHNYMFIAKNTLIYICIGDTLRMPSLLIGSLHPLVC